MAETRQMTGYERLNCALDHRESDRVPFDLGGTMVSGININALRALRAHLGLDEPAELADEVTQMGRTQDDLADAMNIDVRHVRPMPASKPGLARHLGEQDGHDRLIDEFGMGWQMPIPHGHYYDLYLSPL